MQGGSLSVHFKHAEGVVGAEVDGDVIIFNSSSGQYHSIDGVGIRLWSLLIDFKSAQYLVDKICEEYNVDEQHCRGDVVKFLDEMNERGLVQYKDVANCY